MYLQCKRYANLIEGLYFCYNFVSMILVIGGTGFIGSILIRQLTEMGEGVRLLLHPSASSPNLPKSVSVEVTVSSINDERGVRAAMKNVRTVYHLASEEKLGSRANLLKVDIEGTQTVSRAAADAGVERIFYLSHLGADRASAFPLLKAKAIAENHIQHSGVDYTIIRSALAYGVNDHFTNNLAKLIKMSPGIMLLPGDGSTMLQPIWVEDLVTSLVWAMDLPQTINQIIAVGGPEFLSIKEIIVIIMQQIGIKRTLVSIGPVYLNIMTGLIETVTKKFPTSVFWMDYLAADRTCNLDTLPSIFGLNPARFTHRIGYLRTKHGKRS